MIGIIYVSYNMDGFYEYVATHATSIHDMITKIYYPAGMYATLVVDFHLMDLIIFIVIHLGVFFLSILILSKFYFKINSRLKVVSTSKKSNTKDIRIKSHSIYYSFIKKELITFFKTPVFIINAGFGLVLYMIAVIAICIKGDIMSSISSELLSGNIMQSHSIIAFMLLLFCGFMTSITNSVISLEGKNINILKSLPVQPRTILMSKIYASLVITSPVFIIGNIILWIRFSISFIDFVLLFVLSILIPLIPHFIGLIINLKYPKLDFESSAEVVKQSTSSFLSVMIGMILMILSILIVSKCINIFSDTFTLFLFTIICLLMDILCYFYLVRYSVKDYYLLSI